MLGKLFVAAALAAGMAGCSDAGKRPPNEIRRVAVVPVAGDTLELARVGKLAFANRREQLDISHWRLRDEVYGAVKDLLEPHGRHVVSRLDASPALYPALHAAAGAGSCRAHSARRELAQLAADCACDALLLIIEDRRQLDTDRPQYFQGFTWVGQGGVAGSGVSASEAVVALRAVLVDARTHRVIAERRNDEPHGYPGLPRGRVDSRWWPTDMTPLDAAQRAKLEPVFVDLMRVTVQRAVQGTGLLSG